MKCFVIILFLISASFLTLAYGQTQTTCQFGNETTSSDEIFKKDLAVKAFVEKYPQANRTNTANPSDPTNGTLTFKAQTQNEKITLSIEYRINENGCYRPKTYHYSYDDGQIDVTVRNTLGSFSEIINLIKSNDKKLQDFYSDNCSFVELEHSISDGKVYGICKDIENPSITIQAKAYSDGTMQVNIPLEMVYTLNSRDCTTSNDFFVMSARGESPYEITSTEIGNLVSIDLKEGSNKITIAGSWIIPDPSPAQYCGIVMGYDSQFLPPKQQTKRDVELRFIQCNDNYELLVKYDGAPSCVKPEHLQDFLKRGWELPEKHTDFSNWGQQTESEFPEIERLLTENKVDFKSSNLIIPNKTSYEGEIICGAVIDVNSKTIWFQIDSLENPDDIKIYSANPLSCKIDEDSCFCKLQAELLK